MEMTLANFVETLKTAGIDAGTTWYESNYRIVRKAHAMGKKLWIDCNDQLVESDPCFSWNTEIDFCESVHEYMESIIKMMKFMSQFD